VRGIKTGPLALHDADDVREDDDVAVRVTLLTVVQDMGKVLVR